MAETILVIDDSLLMRSIAGELLQQAGFAVRLAGSGEEGLAALAESTPGAILCDVIMPGLDGYSFCRHVRALPPSRQAPVILMTGQVGLNEKVTGLEAGAADFLIKPFEGAELIAKLRPLFGTSAAPRPRVAATRPARGSDRAGGAGGSSEVIACFSLKGGVGTSFIASNVAIALARLWSTPVALVDLHLEQGDAALHLDLTPRRTLQHLAEWQARATGEPAALTEFRAEHPSGVHLYAAPVEPQYAEMVTAEVVGSLLDQISSTYRYAVIDAGSSFHLATLRAFDATDLFLLPLTPDLAALKAMQSTLGALTALGVPAPAQRIVMNQTQPRQALGQRDIDRTIGRPVVHRIPYGEKMTESINRGRPVVLDDPESPVGAAIIGLAHQLTQANAPAPTQQSALFTQIRRNRGL